MTSQTSVFEQADRAIAHLTTRKQAWVTVGIPERRQYLRNCMNTVMAVAEDWVEVTCFNKGIHPDAELAGEEWLSGPVATLLSLRFWLHTLTHQGQPQPNQIVTRPDGQNIAHVFPDNWIERLLWFGFRGEVWLEPNQSAMQGLVYRHKPESGRVALVLGAGNISSIGVLDALHKLFAEDQVVLIKMNPVNAYVGPFLEQAFQPLITDGFLTIVYGDANLGNYLCQHPDIDTIHVTGSQQTHDAIAWGSTLDEQQRNKAANTPNLTKPITAELGCVTPVMVVPGQWSRDDLQFQARHVASMVTHNTSFNCVAAQVLVTAKNWPQREAFLREVCLALTNTPTRRAYYPGAQQRYQAFVEHYPTAQVLGTRTEQVIPWTFIPDVPAKSGELALSTEAFCGVLAEVSLDGVTPDTFLTQATQFVNETVWGSLSCVVFVDAATQQRYQAALETAIAQLRYGSIGVNVWTGMNIFVPSLSWGAFPGNPLSNIDSGQGIIHNSYLFEYPQKSVLWAPFRIQPKPCWFADHKNLKSLAQRLATLQLKPSWDNVLKVLWAALQG